MSGAALVSDARGMKRFGGIAAVLTFALLGVAPAAQAAQSPTAAARAAAAHCPGKHAVPTATTLHRAARATLCLLNAQRKAHGLRSVAPNRVLSSSARRYAKAMVAGQFFSHVSPAGQTLGARVSRYIRGAHGWAYGENLAWGSGARATPQQIMKAWMSSPGHRANILSGRWRHIGIGVAPGAPVGGAGNAASYVTHFGWRN
jgi:uncharacterized protein YkwD